AAMGIAYASTLSDEVGFTTIELKISFLRPVFTGRLLATGRVVKGGRSIGFLECDVTDETGKLVAQSSSTCMILTERREPRR
ncbi:MAG TPA: PaaI family thioesterase, partial [Chloroflexota bacterium]|nr:PaaI family thioesterase [Chloroflexota bacterium]